MGRPPKQHDEIPSSNDKSVPEAPGTIVQHVMSEADSQLALLANAGEFDWDKAIRAVQVLDDYSVLQDPFALPPECQARYANNEFRYRWLDPSDKDRFMTQTTGSFPWVVCNRITAPYIPESFRDARGLVNRGGMILAKMRFDLYMARQTRIWRLSEVNDDRKEVKKDGYEITGQAGGKIKSGDIVVSEEKYDERSGSTWMERVNSYADTDRD